MSGDCSNKATLFISYTNPTHNTKFSIITELDWDADLATTIEEFRKFLYVMGFDSESIKEAIPE